MKLISYWHDTATAVDDFRRTPVPPQVDVAVVGGGFTGLSAALELAKKGASVALLEKNTIGWGASGRNGGMATTGLAVGLGSAVQRYGKDRAFEMFLEYDRAINTIEELVDEHSIDCDFERHGKLSLAYRPSHQEGLEKTAELLREIPDYPELTVLDKDSIQTELGSTAYQGGMVDPRGAGLHPQKFVNGLLRAAVAAGVVVCEDAEVIGIEGKNSPQRIIQTTRGKVSATEVLVGTSGYTQQPFGWLQRRVIPVGSFIVVTEPLSEDQVNRILPNRRQASDSKMLTYYFRITPDNRLLFGGRARFAMSNPRSDVKSAQILKQAISEVFPYLRQARIDYCWGGLVDLMMDQMVHSGKRDGIHYSLGYSGHGVQMAAHNGREMARLILGETDRNLWDDLAFPAVPGHFGWPWFLPFIGGAAKVIDTVR